jgi:hypothetical protein
MTIPSLDIFRREVHGSPVWIDSVEDLRTAKIRLSQLVSKPGEYFVFDQRTNRIVANVVRLGSDAN